MGCPLCDGFGAIPDPLKPEALKKCPECDTEPSSFLSLTLAELVFGPDGPDSEEAEWCDEQERRRLEAVRAEEADYMRRHLAGLIPDDLPT